MARRKRNVHRWSNIIYGPFGNEAKETYKKQGSPFGEKFSTSSRESKKFQEAHSILHLAVDNMTRTCSNYRDKTRDIYGMKQSQKSFINRMTISGYKIQFLSQKIADLSTQPISDKNVKEINQRIKQIDLALEKAKKNAEDGDKIYDGFRAEIKRGAVKSGPEISGVTQANQAAHSSVGALSTLKYIASSPVEK